MRVPLRYAKVKSKETCSLGRGQRNGLFRAVFTGYQKGYPRGHPAHQTQGICIHFQPALGRILSFLLNAAKPFISAKGCGAASLEVRERKRGCYR